MRRWTEPILVRAYLNLVTSHLDLLSLGDLQLGEKVNLERAMLAHSRFGGHFVQV